jgi:hypothetical protein
MPCYSLWREAVERCFLLCFDFLMVVVEFFDVWLPAALLEIGSRKLDCVFRDNFYVDGRPKVTQRVLPLFVSVYAETFSQKAIPLLGGLCT